jgi:hypothetical protein
MERISSHVPGDFNWKKIAAPCLQYLGQRCSGMSSSLAVDETATEKTRRVIMFISYFCTHWVSKHYANRNDLILLINYYSPYISPLLLPVSSLFLFSYPGLACGLL